jgi:hypothetical protein
MSYYIDFEIPHIFIHIPKTAGSSILQVIKQNYNYKVIENSNTTYSNYHSTLDHASEFIQTEFIQAANGDHYVFTVVRNPWSRAASWFYFRKEVLRQGLKALYAGKNSKKVINDFDVVKAEYDLMDRGFNKWLPLYYNHKWDHTWFSLNDTQHSWIESNNFKVNNIIKFENIDNEIAEVPIFKNKVLPLHNVGPVSYDYVSMYNKKSKKLIEQIYEIDIDTFKYTFK